MLEAANGGEALDVARAQRRARSTLLLTDVVMPDINGPDFVSRLDCAPLVEGAVHVRIRGQPARRTAGSRDRTVAILQKPFAPEELLARVSELLASDDVSSDA